MHMAMACVCTCNEGVVLLWLQREPDGERLGARHAGQHAAGQRRPRRDGQQPDRRRQGQGRRGQTEGRRVEKQRHGRQGTRPSRSDTASIAAFFRPNELTTLDLLDYAVLLIMLCICINNQKSLAKSCLIKDFKNLLPNAYVHVRTAVVVVARRV